MRENELLAEIARLKAKVADLEYSLELQAAIVALESGRRRYHGRNLPKYHGAWIREMRYHYIKTKPRALAYDIIRVLPPQCRRQRESLAMFPGDRV
jgi:hypothetical protein